SVYKPLLSAAAEPDLHPDTSKVVILPLPLRSREHVYQALGLNPQASLLADENACYEYLDAGAALELFAAEFAAGNGSNARQVHANCFRERGDRRLGFCTLLAACGIKVSADRDLVELAAGHADDPLARYLLLVSYGPYRVLQRNYDANLGGFVGPRD